MLGRLVKRRIDWNLDYCFKVRISVGKAIVIRWWEQAAVLVAVDAAD
jgi:hypothetical protein